MRKLDRDERPTYILSYSRRVRFVRSALVVVLVGAAVLNWGLAWVRFFLPLIEAVNTSGDLGAVLAVQPLRPLIAGNLGLLLTIIAVGFVPAFLPDLSLAEEGLAVRYRGGWRLIPWSTVAVVRIMTLEKSTRRLVVVQGNWTRWSLWPRLVSVCLGAGFEPGVLLTSDIQDFKPLMSRLYREVRAAAPDALFDDEFFSPSATLVFEPTPTLAALTDQARDEAWPLGISAQMMGAVAAGLILVQLLMLVMGGGAWWKPLALAGICAMEWLIGAMYLYALTELFPTILDFQEGALLYPLPQIPRALLAVPMAMFVVAGAPFIAAMLGLVGVLWAVILTALLVQQLYRLESILPAMIGGTLQALFQFLILAIVFT